MKRYKLQKYVAIAVACSLSCTGCHYEQANDYNNSKNSNTNCSNTNCSNTNISNINFTQSDNDSIHYTSDYYLIYLDNAIHLATKKTYCTEYQDAWKNNINYDVYYDVANGKIVGTTFSPAVCEPLNEFKRGFNDYLSFKRDFSMTIDVQLYDYFANDGEYGYGKNIPSIAIQPLTSYLKTDIVSEEELQFLGSHSNQLLESYLSSIYYDIEKEEIGVQLSIDYYNSSYKTEYVVSGNFKNVPLHKYICTKNDETKEILIGYRCSLKEKDSGYNYIYDILTGTIHYIGPAKKDSFVHIEESIYDNSVHETCWNLRDEYHIEVPVEEETIEESATEETIEESVEETIEESVTEETIEESVEETMKKPVVGGLYILDIESKSVVDSFIPIKYVDSEHTNGRYHLFSIDLKIPEHGYMYNFEYNNSYIVNPKNSISSFVQVATLYESPSSYYLTYDSECISVQLFGENLSDVLMDVNYFLAENGYDNLIKADRQYSDDEISNIQQCLQDLNSQKQYIK